MSHGLKMPFGKNDHIRVIKCIAEGLREANALNYYLELGISKGVCFNEIAPLTKTAAYAVDINDTSYPHIKYQGNLQWFCGTTDDFFKLDSLPKFDLIFIDAEHSHKASKQDFINSFGLLKSNGIICLHDTYPPNEKLFEHCKDSYKTAKFITDNYIFLANECELVTLPFYYGITIVRKRTKQLMWMK